jgi:hypothetical protein
MTLPQDTMMELMAFADGELDGEAHARIASLVASNDEARRVVEAMGGLGDWLRDGIDARADRAKADGIADAVMAQIATSAAPDNTPVNVRPVAQAASAPVTNLPVTNLSERREALATARSSGGGRGRVIGGAIGVLALAAAAVLVVRRGDTPVVPPVAQTGPVERPAIGPLPGASPEEAPALAQVAPAAGTGDVSGVDVEQVESPSHQVSVFYLPAVAAAAAGSSASSASSVVVWIGDDKVSGGH